MADEMEGTRLGSESLYDFKSSGGGTEKLKATRLGEMDEFEKSLGLAAPQYDAPTMAPAGSKPKAAPASPSVVRTVVNRKKTLPDNPSMEDALTSVQNLEVGDIVEGTVTRLENGGVYMDFKYKSEGFIPLSELNPGETIEVGQTIVGMIGHLESKEGYTILSKRRATEEIAWRDLARAYKRKDVVTVYVVGSVSGGLVVEYQGVRGFVPASHVLHDSQETLENFLNTKIPVKVLQLDKRRRKCVMSHKLATHIAGAPKDAEAIRQIQVGQTVHGKVTSIKDFGAFVDVGGVEGLIHISEMSWSRIEHASQLLHVGQEIDVFILGVDPESRKVSLGLKQLQRDPWVTIGEKYQVGDVVKGTVSRLVSFGAFVKLDGDIEGLVHISELSHKHIKEAKEAVQPGQVVEAKIIRVIAEEQKIGLSIKQALDDTSAPAVPAASPNPAAAPTENHTQMAEAMKQAQASFDH